MSYIICFWDKSKRQVSNEVGEKLKEAISSESIKTFEFGNSLYVVAGVEKIIPKISAYEVFPTEYAFLQSMEDEHTTEDLISLESPKLKFRDI